MGSEEWTRLELSLAIERERERGDWWDDKNMSDSMFVVEGNVV